ncbi:MAG: hypothetical protein WBQ54_06040 [Pseudolabrys sp.]
MPETSSIGAMDAPVITAILPILPHRNQPMTGPAAYQSLPPAEDCQVGYRFISALASMNEKLGAFAYKGLIGASQ